MAEKRLLCTFMITVQGLHFGFGGQELYHDVSFDIHPGERIGLIGRNGTGKSSILRLLHGDYQGGSAIQKMRGLKTAFFNQDLLSYQSDEGILWVASQAFADLLAKREQYEAITLGLAEKHDQATLELHAHLYEELELADAFHIEVKVEKTLRGLGFSNADMQKPFSQFSGGWRMRVMLAKCLLEAPDLLMLDEPTNHLDLPAIQWLETYLKGYDGCVLIVSHDRRFLNQICLRIMEVENKSIRSYKGNYENFEEQKALRLELEMQTYKNQQKQLDQEMRFIERFRSKASKAKAVQSRVKLIEKRELVTLSETDNRRINMNLRIARQPGKIIAELENVSKAYPGIQILQNASAMIERGDKIALIGPNGKGKSTLLRMVHGSEALEGEVKHGYAVSMSFYAQHQLESLRLTNTILEEAQRLSHNRTEQELRNTLGAFLFSNEEVEKKVKVLSGGEKARVALAGIMLSEANFLLFDEPTNHLDMEAVDMLIESLQQYEGSFIVVSHDRYFLEEVANKLWYIQDGEIKVYPGDYRAFVEQYGEEFFFQKDSSITETPAKKAEATASKGGGKAEYERQKELRKQLNKLQNQLQRLEADIEKSESRKAELQNKIAQKEIFNDFDTLQACQIEIGSLEKNLKSLHEQWEKLYVDIEKTEATA